MSKHKVLRAVTVLLATLNTVYGSDYLDDFNPSTPLHPTSGLANDVLRKQYPGLAAWDIGAQVRLRYEIKDNFGIPGAGAASVDFSQQPGVRMDNAYFLDRLKPHIGYNADWFGIFVEGRSSGTTNDKRNPNPESDGPIDLHQGFITLGNPKQFPLSAKVGRQELTYGDERLIGVSDWNNIARVFDAAKLRWQQSAFSADLFSGRVIIPYDNHFNMPNDYDWFSGLYVTTKVIPKQTTEAYLLARNTSGESPNALVNSATPAFLKGASARDIYTIGVRVKSTPGAFAGWDYYGELMGQYGHFNDPAKPAGSDRSLEHQAFAFYAGAGYTWTNTSLVPRLGLEYNFASGDSDPNDNKHETFEVLFPTFHKYYGFMNFLSLQNLHDLRLLSSIKPIPRLTLQAEGHFFWLADTHDSFYNVTGAKRGGNATTAGNGYGINPGYHSDLGSEVDVIGTYMLTSYSNLQVGYGHFFRGDYIKQSLSAVGSGDANWFYVQTTFSF
ncbi:MAG TPA: alginate export family protein [Candidatus Saccharimonadales bacterium]|nr:alginate export family protein [Candidatus Saccharimonadales bacterium]